MREGTRIVRQPQRTVSAGGGALRLATQETTIKCDFAVDGVLTQSREAD